ncbi:MAG TPA: EcsC family protein [Terriglobia bacterium]|nr:EcsC family protein [Terriglobia bacterium]
MASQVGEGDIQGTMATAENYSWLTRRVQEAIHDGLSRAYETIKVDADRYLLHLRRAHGLPVESFAQIHRIQPEVLDTIADQTISAGMKLAAAEGLGLGLGGIFTALPDIGVLSAITMRMLQKLSLVYGFEYSTDAEIAELWVAAASAAGVNLGKELLEKEVIERFVPRVMEVIALKAGAEIGEKWAARMIPVVSGLAGSSLNYYFVRQWGRRAKRHFRERHMRIRHGQEFAPIDRRSLLPASAEL